MTDRKRFPTKDGGETLRMVPNVQETRMARRKQDAVRSAFKEWIQKDPNRISQVERDYNQRFNLYRVRQYDGSKLVFPGMAEDIHLREHQVNSVARCLYSGKNTLLAHVVGAGKTYVMIAAVMEMRRLGLAQKPLIVVPNHLTVQWGTDFLRLYPGANILVAAKRDFEPENRKRFIGRICTGDYDAVILGFTQFERIAMTPAYTSLQLKRQIDEVAQAIDSSERDTQRYTVKQLERAKANLEAKLQELNSGEKDQVVSFEETGIDYLVVDEAHYYKNCFISTRMNNVAGIHTTSSKKSFDLLMKIRYLTEKMQGRGVIFATGTPVSNSMTELYVMQRYLQAGDLEASSVGTFDDWASTFGETEMVLELKPEGTGLRKRTRFSKFHNLPELMKMFSQVADIKVKEDLNLPVPQIETGKPLIVIAKPSEEIKQFIQCLGERAEVIRMGKVDAMTDNMLKVTNDGRKAALDYRLINPLAADDPGSKVNLCVEKLLQIWRETANEKGAQLVFCDLSTPSAGRREKPLAGKGFSNVYEDLRRKLTSRGIPLEEIAFIHEAGTDARKAELFAKVRRGEVRILLGSTGKMGAGTNVQTRLAALHHLDCPWRPGDVEQRDGRGIRQGNRYPSVRIFRYVTENTFDSYMWVRHEVA